MKKTILALIFAVISTLYAAAATPQLECESYFGEKYRNNPTTRVVVVTGTGNYFRSITVEGNPTLVKQIKASVNKDRRHADNVTESYSGGETKIVLNLSNGVNIGFSQDSDSDCSLFVQGTPEAFK